MYDLQILEQYLLDQSDDVSKINVKLWDRLNAVGE